MSISTDNVRSILASRRAKVVSEPKPIAGKAPPHDLDAERAVITACITRTKFDAKDTVDRVISIVGDNGEAFFGKTHALVFDAIAKLHAAGATVDMVTLPARLRELDAYQQDVETFLVELTTTMPAIGAKFVAEHARIVAKKAKLRRWIYAAQEGAAFAYGDVPDADAFISERNTVLEEIGRQMIATQPTSTLVEAAGVLNAEIEQQLLAQSLGVSPGLPTGIDTLDQLTGGIHNTDVVMLSGPRKGFKSSAMTTIGVNVASVQERYTVDGNEFTRRAGVGIFELEMTPQKIAFTASCQLGRVDRSRFRKGHATREDLAALVDGQRMFGQLPIVIDPRTDTNVSNLRARIREVRFRCMVEFKCPLRLVMIDTLQLFALRPAHRPNEEQALVDAAMATVREVSLEPENARTAFLVTSQVNAEGEMRGSRAIEMHCNEWWHLEVTEDRGPLARPGVRVAKFVVKMGRDVEKDGESAPAWVHAPSGRFFA